MKTVAEKLAEARNAKGKTIRQVAAELGLSSQSIGFTEMGSLPRKMVSDATVKRIAEHYGLEGEKIAEQYAAERYQLKAIHKSKLAEKKAAK